jgi:hypothetical protein
LEEALQDIRDQYVSRANNARWDHSTVTVYAFDGKSPTSISVLLDYKNIHDFVYATSNSKRDAVENSAEYKRLLCHWSNPAHQLVGLSNTQIHRRPDCDECRSKVPCHLVNETQQNIHSLKNHAEESKLLVTVPTITELSSFLCKQPDGDLERRI